MSKKSTALADMDIVSEGLNQQDGLAERVARARAQKAAPTTTAEQHVPVRAADPNAYRRGKALLQVMVEEDAHMELSVIAKRRRSTLSRITKEALNDWLEKHGHTLRLPD